MSPAALLPFVEKFPNVSREERDLLLDFVRTTPLLYGAWKPFKKLFKTVEAALHDGQPDIEMMAAFLERIDNALWTQSSTRWKAVEATQIGQKAKSVEGGDFTYFVGSRNSWYDYTGWRLVIRSKENKGVISSLRKALGLTTQDEQTGQQTIAFDFDARTYIYEVKNVSLENGELKILCGPSYRGVQNREKTFVVDASDPNFIHLQTDGPKTPTLQYMKRRARRILRHLSQKNPDLYVQLAMQLLRAEGNRVLDAATNWAAMDVLFAQSPRRKQLQPGRGAYKNVGGFVRLRREERAPQIWDAHLEQTRELLTSQNVPLQANEMALKVLRANGEDFTNRVLERAQLERFLSSELPLLQVLATRQLAQVAQNSEELDGAVWANLMLRANAQTRRALNEKRSDDAQWNDEAAQVLSESLGKRGGAQKRRAAGLLLERFEERISDDVFWRNLETFGNVNERARNWMLERVRQQARFGQLARLGDIARLQSELQEQVMEAFFAESAHLQPSAEEASKLVANQDDQALNVVGWQFLAATSMTKEAARTLWLRMWGIGAWTTAALQATAAASEGARQLFERASFSAEELSVYLAAVPAFFAQLAPAFFASVFGRLSPALQIEHALTANDDQWIAARATLLQTLENDERRGAFWNRVLDLVSGDENTALLGRIIDDNEISATFARVPSEKIAELLERTDPVLEPWLARWLDANIGTLQRGDSALMFAAMSPLGEIRARGLARVEELGLDLPLALRLMESGLPQPFEAARRWFESHQELDVADRALALCDSPDANVQAFGRTFLEAHVAQVLDAKILKKLSENPDPQMQAWLAEHLLTNAQDVDVAAFDHAVLRARGRARRAKEAVKMRRDSTRDTAKPRIEYSNDEVATLLDVARGQTLRDKEWALQQLAQAALSGRKIEGVVLAVNEP